MKNPKLSRVPKHLVVYTHVAHCLDNDCVVAHAGFVLEIDIWARIFEKVTVIGPFSHSVPKADSIPYSETNIVYHRMGVSTDLGGFRGKLILLLLAGKWLYQGSQPLTPNSIIMARGPGSPGLIGAILALIRRYPRFAKYADQLTSYPGETFGVKIQRAFLKSGLFGGPVLVYGHSDPNRPHLVPVNLPLSISPEEWEHAGIAIQHRPEPPPFKLLFTGRLSSFKGVDLLLKAVHALLDEGLDIYLDIVGDGDNRKNLETLCEHLSISDRVTFHGWLSRKDVFEFYSNAYCLINCSKRQGIDKVLIEAMTYQLPVVATEGNIVGMILEPPRCGLTYKVDDLAGLINQLRVVLRDQTLAHRMGREGRNETRDMRTDNLETMYRKFLHTYFEIDC